MCVAADRARRDSRRARRLVARGMSHATSPTRSAHSRRRCRSPSRGRRSRPISIADRARRGSAPWSPTRATSSRCSTRRASSPIRALRSKRVLGYSVDEIEGTRFDRLVGAERSSAPRSADDRRQLAETAKVTRSNALSVIATARLLRFEMQRTDLLERRARPRLGAEQSRHQRAQGVRGPTRAPGVPRPGHEARQSRTLLRSRRARADALHRETSRRSR